MWQIKNCTKFATFGSSRRLKTSLFQRCYITVDLKRIPYTTSHHRKSNVIETYDKKHKIFSTSIFHRRTNVKQDPYGEYLSSFRFLSHAFPNPRLYSSTVPFELCNCIGCTCIPTARPAERTG